MNDPSLAVHDAFVRALKAASDVTALVGARVFDSVPPKAKRPYVEIGQPQVLANRADCIAGAALFLPVHGWCDGPAKVQIKQLGDAILAALDDAALDIAGHRLVVCQLEQSQYLPDPDPEIQHVVVLMHVETEPL